MGRKRSGRVKIPFKVNEIIALAKGILKKHTEDGEDSPLNVINERLKMEEMSAIIAAAEEYDLEAEEHRRAAERLREQRNIELKKLLTMERDASVFLKGLYKNLEHMLGDWGFTVDSSPQRNKNKGKTE